MDIGKRIKDLRKSKKMTLTELAGTSGVQIATLSRMENSKMTGTLDSHMNIARALGIDITELYREVSPLDSSLPQSVPEKAALESFTFNDAASYEILTNNVLTKKMMPIILKIEAGGKTSPEQKKAGSETFIFVLEGEIEAHIGDKGYPLSKNQSLYFDSTLKHYFENKGKITAKVISVATPVSL